MYSQSTEEGLDLDLIRLIEKEIEVQAIAKKIGLAQLKNIIIRHADLMYQDSLIGNNEGVKAHAVKIAAYASRLVQKLNDGGADGK